MNSTHNQLRVETYNSIFDIDKAAYLKLVEKAQPPIFYQWDFLVASEEAQLLPIEDIWYFVAYRGKEVVGFVQSYAMRNADPFGVIAQNTGIVLNQHSQAWLSHIMHFYESTIVHERGDFEVCNQLLAALYSHGKLKQGACVGLMNVTDQALLEQAAANNWRVNYMWDRYYINFANIASLDDLLANMDRFGRNEIRRQLRKYNDSTAVSRILRPPFDNLEQVAELCYATTKKNGTPQYYPPKIFCEFIRKLGDHVLIFVIEQDSELLGTLVCFESQNTLHLWAGGMTYEKSKFSPYTLLFHNTYIYAIQRGISLVEAGRTNKKIKERLGFSAKHLYTILHSL